MANKGSVSKYDPEKCFGFIAPDDGSGQVHFRSSVVKGGTIAVGDSVEYEAMHGDRGLTAKWVTVKDESADWNTCFFISFYGQDGQIRKELFYDAPNIAVRIFRKNGLKPTALRAIYQAFLKFAGPLRDGRMSFQRASELFNIFFVERIVRQNMRGHLPKQVLELFERHKELALSSPKELLGLFRYITNIICYYGDKD